MTDSNRRPLTNHEPTYEIDYHRHDFVNNDGDPTASIIFDALDDEGSGKLFCEVSVYWLFEDTDADPLISYERTNLYNAGGPKSGWMGVAERMSEYVDKVDWHITFRKAVHATIEEYRRSASTWKSMDEITLEDVEEPYLLQPIVASNGVTVLYAPGGAGKSTLALGIAYAVATGNPIFGVLPKRTGNVLYVDFEDSVDVHNVRLTAIHKGHSDDESDPWSKITHMQVTGSLRDVQRKLRAVVRDQDYVLAVIDSVGLARAGDVSSSESTIRMFKALHHMRIPVLALDHVRKEVWESLQKQKRRIEPRTVTAIGSQFTMSSARLAWFMEPVPTLDQGVSHFNMHNTKANHVAPQESFALTFKRENNERGLVRNLQFETPEGLFRAAMQEESTRIAIAKMLQEEGNLTGTQLGRELEEIKDDTIRKALSREMELDELKRWFTKVEKVGKGQPYALTEWGSAAVTFYEGEE